MSGSGPVVVGVVGAGNISSEYLRNMTAFPDLDVRFVADMDQARARGQADAFGVTRAGSLAELLADDEIELVVNLTIPSAHVEVAILAIDAGKHVWSEKPFALDRGDGARLLEAARAAGRRVACAPDTFLGASLQASRRFVETGGLGRPMTALTLVQGPGPESWHPNPDFLFQDGAGPLFDIGPYYLTTLVQLFGPVARVVATTSKSRDSRMVGSGPRAGQRFDVTVPTHVGALYEFESGQTAMCVFSFDSQLQRTQFEVTGTDATLVVPDPNQFSGDLVVHRADAVETVASIAAKGTRGTGVAELAQAIRADRPERASGELGFHVLDVMVSTIESGERNEPVDVASSVEVAPIMPEDWDPRVRTL